MSDKTEAKVAVFFDYENIVYSLRNRFEQKANFEALMTKCNEFGRVVEARAFADWGLPYMSPALMYALQSSGFDLIFVPTGSTQANSPRKNVADLYMAIQVMEVLHARPDISIFVLMTGDRDFMPLVNHLKRSGKHVVAIGVDGSSSYYLTQSVDDFYYYSEVEQIFEGKPKRTKGRLTNAYDALVQAIRVTREKGKSSRMTNLKSIMIDLMSGFDEKELQDSHGRHFQRFKDFVQEAQRRGLVRIVRRGNSHEVHLAEQEGVRNSSANPEGDPIGLQVAYKLLVQAVKDADDEGKSFRASTIRTRICRLHKGFNEQLVYNGGGKPFETFLDFAQAAEKAGLVEIKGGGSNVEICPIGEAEPEKREVVGDEARAAVLQGLRTYSNYPTSFLSLASFVHRYNEQQGLSIEDQLARNLMTEAVDLGLLKQIILENGRRKYQLQNEPALCESFLQYRGATKEAEAVPADANGSVDTKKPAPQTNEATPEVDVALKNAVQMLLADGKEPLLPRIKSSIKRQIPGFSETSLTDNMGNPFLKFKDFILDAQQRGLIYVVEGKDAQPKVALTKPSPAPSNAGVSAEENVTETPNDAISSAEITAAIAEANVVVEEPKVSTKAPAHESYKKISETEQRELIVEGLRTFRNYPAPFMAILAHCRGIRDEREVYLGNSDLREMLSESNKTGLLSRTTERNKRPTLYAYGEDEQLVRQFIYQEQPEPVTEAEVESESSAETDSTTPVEAQPEPVVVSEVVAPVVEKAPEPDPEATDSELRQFVIETLRGLSESGTQFRAIESLLKQSRDAANIVGSNQRLKNLLQFASRQGVLEVISPYGMRPRLFGFTSNEEAVNAYLGITPEPVEEPTPAVEEPVATASVEAETPVVEAEAPVIEAAPEVETPVVEAEPIAEESVAEPEPDNDIYSVLRAAVEQLISEEKSTGFSSVKRRMTKIMPGFNEKLHEDENGQPFNRFKDFVLAAQGRGVVQLHASGKYMLPIVESAEPVEEPAEAVVEAAPVAEVEEPVVEATPVEAVPAEETVEEEAAVEEPSAPVEEAPETEPAVIAETEPEPVVETEPVVVSEIESPVDPVVDEAAEATTEVVVEPIVEDASEQANTQSSIEAIVAETVAEVASEQEDQESIEAIVAETIAEVEASDPLTRAYSNLETAVTDAIAAGRSQRLPAIRTRLVRLDAAFDIAKLRKVDGKKFKSLPDFIRSAEKEGYVRLEGKGAQLTVHLPE